MTFGMLGRQLTALAIVLGALAVGSTVSLAEEAEQKPSAVGLSEGWNADVAGGGSDVAGTTLDDTGLAAVAEINDYFNTMDDLQGTFRQTDARDQKLKGKFFIKRPGKFRFAYGAPSRLVILSDGSLLSYEDYDLKSVDRYPLESTPFKMLLEPKVDLLRDAQVTEFNNDGATVSIALTDKAEESSGQMKLYFTRTEDGLQLKEWVITSPDGSDTRVEVANLVAGKQVDPKLFQGTTVGMEFQSNR